MNTAELLQNKKLAIAWSGGARSVVTSILLRSQGYDLHAVHLKMGPRAEEQAKEAKKRATQMGVAYHEFDATDAFEEQVMDYALHQTTVGRRPDLYPQFYRQVYFPRLFQAADELGCGFVTTGHSAQIIRDLHGGNATLTRASDPALDQSFHLYSLKPDQLMRLLLPMGGLTTFILQKLSVEYGVPWVDTPALEGLDLKSSTWTEYVGKVLAEDLRPTGLMQATEGNTLGEHRGLYQFWIGKTGGLPIAVKKPEEYFVLGFDLARHVVVVGEEKLLNYDQFVLTDLTWSLPMDPMRAHRLEVRLKPRGDVVEGEVRLEIAGQGHLKLDHPVKALAPGDTLVFYHGEEVIGGGVVDRMGRPHEVPRENFGV